MNRVNLDTDSNNAYASETISGPSTPEEQSTEPIPLFLNEVIAVGAIGTVHSSGGSIVVKFAHRSQEIKDLMLKEAFILNAIQKLSNVQATIPRFYGLFKNDQDMAIVLSHEGKTLDSFKTLTLEQR
jgi:hypothetical protein